MPADGPPPDPARVPEDAPGQAKRALRRRLRAARAARSSADRAAAAAGLRRTGLAADALRRSGVVSAYAAVPGEPDPGALRRALRGRGTTVILPVAGSGGMLTWGLDDGRLRPGRPHPSGLVIDEPVTPAGPLGLLLADVVLLPALAVDLAGARLGQGGGYFDRALAALDHAGPPDLDGGRTGGRALLVAVCHDDEVLEAGAVPTAAHDRLVDAVLTPTRWVELR